MRNRCLCKMVSPLIRPKESSSATSSFHIDSSYVGSFSLVLLPTRSCFNHPFYLFTGLIAAAQTLYSGIVAISSNTALVISLTFPSGKWNVIRLLAEILDFRQPHRFQFCHVENELQLCHLLGFPELVHRLHLSQYKSDSLFG